MSDGFKSTEFWLVIALLALVVANTPLGLGLNSQELISMAIAVAGYSGARGLAKFTPSPTTIIGPQETAKVENVTQPEPHAKPPYPPGYAEDRSKL